MEREQLAQLAASTPPPRPTDDITKIQTIPGIQFFSTGSTLLDIALNGGWAGGRVANIVGDKSTGKTLLAIEAFANFKRTFEKCRMKYAEAESAFDDAFAEQLGFPKEVERELEPLETVEQFKLDLYKFADKDEGPSLYILDSLDALSDAAEMEQLQDQINDKKAAGSFGVGKPKELSKMFRQIVKKLGKQNCTLVIISQIRDKIGVTFGETKTRSGGRALDFYASQVVWLHETGKIKRTVKGQDLVTGVEIHSKVKKNKVGKPFREADYGLIFGYGVDNEMSMISWLKEVKAIDPAAAADLTNKIQTARNRQDYQTLTELEGNLKKDCISLWNEIERKVEPPIRKYR